MVIVKFQGGLGNQMFQRAFLEYMKRYTDDVWADLSEYNGISYHNGYELSSVFGDDVKEAKRSDIAKCANSFQISHHTVFGLYLNCYLENVMKAVRSGKHSRLTHIYEKQFLQMMEKDRTDLVCAAKRLYFEGFWFNKSIYDSVNLSGIFAFSPSVTDKCKEYKDKIEATESCSLHIRLGDYINNSEFGILGKDYYTQAIQHIRSQAPKTVFFLFSDDIEKAKKMFDDSENIEYVETIDKNDSGVDMYLMSCCKNNIIANSSYSFWGAKLNQNIKKIVVAPGMFTSGKRFEIAADEGWHII